MEVENDRLESDLEEPSDAVRVDPHGAVLQSMASLHARVEREINPHQRFIERLTGFLGRPVFLYSILSVVAAWLVINLLAPNFRFIQWDAPPFPYLQGAMALGSLLMTTMVLITQNRQASNNQRRNQLQLQINLLAEQKITKLISLLEELRQDMPQVANRFDAEATAMTQSTDPEAALIALDFMLGETESDIEQELPSRDDKA